MKVKVVISFHDAASFSLIHKVGDVLDVPEDRARKLIGLGLVKKVEKAEQKVEEPEAPVETAPEVTEAAEPKKKRRSRR